MPGRQNWELGEKKSRTDTSSSSGPFGGAWSGQGSEAYFPAKTSVIWCVVIRVMGEAGWG